MKHLISVVITVGLVLMATGCDNNDDDSTSSVEVITNDINSVGQYLNLASEAMVDPYDVAFDDGYEIHLNGAAKVLSTVAEGTTFEAATLPAGGYTWDSTATPAIGSGWMDYNPATHEASVKANVYFIRTSAFNWVKMAVDSFDGTTFNIRYAVMAADSSYGAIVSKTVVGTAGLTTVNLDNADAAAVNWQIGMVTSPIYAGPTQGYMYMPEVIVNYNSSVTVGIITDVAYADLTLDHVDNVATWLSDAAETHHLGYEGTHEILKYHPEPPYNHAVIVEEPDYTYIIDDGSGDYYKLRFKDYDSGIILLEYEAL